jgi:Zn-dependent protease with chaperone function
MQIRYADGRAATTRSAECDLGIGADALKFRLGDTEHVWVYADVRRADDGGGRIILKRRPDTGERLYFEPEAQADLRIAAPELFGRKAFEVESPAVVGGLVAAAWSLAAVFLLGVPIAAEPIAAAIPARYREQIGDISWSQVDTITAQCDDSDEASRILNDVAYRLMTTSNVAQRDEIWISIVDAPFPNAFALPDNSIIVTDDLIAMAEQPDELVGVIAHEIAHIEHNHIMKNIVRSMGAGIFFDVVVGGAGLGQMAAITSVNLASLRFSRGDESDADNRGLDYLDAAGIDTGGLARIFDRFAEHAAEEGGGDIPTLISSHPATAARAAAARSRARAGLAPSMSAAEWRIVRSACGANPDMPAGGDEETPTTPTLPQSPPQPAPPPSGPAAPAQSAKPEQKD